MKATSIPSESKCFWLRCERPAQGLHPAEVWYAAAGSSREQAEAEKQFCERQWPEIKFAVADYVPQA